MAAALDRPAIYTIVPPRSSIRHDIRAVGMAPYLPHGCHARYILTVPSSGYSFTRPLEEETEELLYME